MTYALHPSSDADPRLDAPYASNHAPGAIPDVREPRNETVTTGNAVRHYVDALRQFPAFLRFSSSPIADHRENFSNAGFDTFEICNSALNAGLTREQQIAVTVSLLSWLLGVYRREATVCVILQCNVSGTNSIDTHQWPLILATNQEAKLYEHCDAWQATLQRSIEVGPVPLTLLRAALKSIGYEQADLLQQILLCWTDDSIETNGFEDQAADRSGAYPLQIHVISRHSEQRIRVRYDRNLITRELAEGLFEQYQMLLHDYGNYRSQRLRDIELLNTTDRYLLDRWNETAKAYDLSQPYHAYVSRWAQTTPDKVAVQFGEHALTYRDLDRHSSVLARLLSERGISRGDRVGQYVGRSLEMVIGIIAVNKIGAIFVPLDPSTPSARVEHILNDSGVQVLLVSRGSTEKLRTLIDEQVVAAENVLFIEDAYASTLQPMIEDIQVQDCRATAYLIYTSGSTGKPKGVQVTHRALINHNLACQEIYGLTPSDHVLQLASIGFDHSLEEMLPTLVSGARLVLYPDQQGLSIEQLNQVLQEHHVSVFMPTTALWKLWAAHSVRKGRFEFPDLRVCAIGGERCPKELLIAWLELCGKQVELQAGYGVTEATITSTMWQPDAATLDVDLLGEVPIGKPMGNTRLYIVDQYLRRVPIGAEGELCVAGEGVALGYWNRPAETEKRFVIEPEPTRSVYQSIDTSTGMYRTGDIVKFTANGNLIYVTREDNQLKVNGYRVELTELEMAIASVAGVQECVVVAYERAGQKHLSAFLRTADGIRITPSDLREKVPAYAMPHKLIHVTRFPLNSSAKIDRQRLAREAAALLPEAESAKDAVTVSTHAGSHESLNRSRAHEIVTATWRQTLGLTEIQPDDDFFQLGGSSLLAILMFEKLHTALSRRVDANAFLANPTIEGTVDALLGNFLPGQPRYESPPERGAALTIT